MEVKYKNRHKLRKSELSTILGLAMRGESPEAIGRITDRRVDMIRTILKDNGIEAERRVKTEKEIRKLMTPPMAPKHPYVSLQEISTGRLDYAKRVLVAEGHDLSHGWLNGRPALPSDFMVALNRVLKREGLPVVSGW